MYDESGSEHIRSQPKRITRQNSNIQIDDLYFHNIQFSLMYLVSFLIIAISCVYYFSANDFNNRILLQDKEVIVKDFPFYKIVSKNSIDNSNHIIS